MYKTNLKNTKLENTDLTRSNFCGATLDQQRFNNSNFSYADLSFTNLIGADLKNAKAYVIPLGGKDTEKTVNILTEFSYLIRKAMCVLCLTVS